MRPTDDQLRRFLAGTLPADEVEQVASWVEAAPDAAEALARLERPDTLAAALAHIPGERSTRPLVPKDVSTANVTAGDDTDDPPVLDRGDSTADSPHDRPTRAWATATGHPSGGGVSQSLDLPTGYQFIGELGRGGMGVVYRARDLQLDREVAVKVLGPNVRRGSSAGVRFRDEARITGQLQHPGIPPVYRMGELPDGRPFLAMKLIKGRTLADLLTNDPAAVNRLGVFEGVCQAVGYAHAHGVIHRDLKPGNVMVGSFGEVQVMDWGLAKVLGGGQRYAEPAADPDDTRDPNPTKIRSARESDTEHGSVLGTPAFMAPEQAIGAVDQLDRRTDVFGLGGILCVLLTGRPPYVASDGEATRQLAARARLGDCFARLDASGAEPELVAVCKRCLGAEPADRPADGWAVAAAVGELRAAADERARRAETAAAEAVVREAEGRTRRRVMRWATTAVVGVLVVGAAVSAAFGVEANSAREKEVTAKLAAQAAEGKAIERAAAEEKAKGEEKAAKEDAERKKTEAEKATAEANRERKVAETQRTRAEGLLTEGLLGKARDAIQGDNIRLAKGLLNDTPWHMRGWEYRHLWTRVTAPLTFRTDGSPTSLCFSADGSMLAASVRSGKGYVVWTWDLRTNTARQLAAAPGEWSLHLEAGGKDELVGVRPDLVIQKWDLRTGERTYTSAGKPLHNGVFPEDSHVCFSPDRKWVAYSPNVGGMDYTQQVKLWDVEKDELARKLSLYKKAILHVAYSPKGTHVASNGADKTLRLWDLEADTESVLDLGVESTSSFQFTPDGTTLVVSTFNRGESSYKVWSIADKKVVRTLPATVKTVGEFSTDGRWFVSGGPFGQVQIFEYPSCQLLRTFNHIDGHGLVKFSPDGKKLATTNGSGLIYVWDTARDNRPPTLTAGKGPVRSAAFAPDGKTFATGGEGTFSLWDADAMKLVRTVPNIIPGQPGAGVVWGVAYSPDGQHLAVCGRELSLWEAKTGKFVKAFPKPGAVLFHVAFSPDGKRVYVGTAGWNHTTNKAAPGEVWGWEVETGEKIAQFTAMEIRASDDRNQVDALAVAPDGQVFTGGYEGGPGGVIKIWNPTDHTLVRGLSGHPGRVKAITFDPTGTRMASSCQGDTLILWDTKTWKPLQKARIRGGQLDCLRFSNDGSRLFGGCQDGSVRVLNADTLQEMLSLAGHGLGTIAPGADVLALALSPEGNRLVSGGKDGTIRIWESLRSPEYAALSGHRQPVTAVAYSADGSKVYGWDKTGECLAWWLRDGSPADPADAPEDRHPGPLTSQDGRFRAEAAGSLANGDVAVRVWFLPPNRK